MKLSYYTLTSSLKPGWRLPQPRSLKMGDGELEGGTGERVPDVTRWPDPPHVALANLGYKVDRPSNYASNDEIRRFAELYGTGFNPIEETGDPGEPLWLSVHNFHLSQQRLREAWEKKNPVIFTDRYDLSQGKAVDWLPVEWEVKSRMIEIRPRSCYTYMGLLLARDIAIGCAKICGNPQCIAPYFVALRRDAKYCSHPCAVAVNVKNFRERQRTRRKRRKKR